jgi:hypothetical protein
MQDEFTVEPKKASGAVVLDAPLIHGQDIFCLELCRSEDSIVDGSHSWYSDGGGTRYNPVLYEEQVIHIPNNTDSFVITINISPSESKGYLGGFTMTMDMLPGDEDWKELELALCVLGTKQNLLFQNCMLT